MEGCHSTFCNGQHIWTLDIHREILSAILNITVTSVKPYLKTLKTKWTLKLQTDIRDIPHTSQTLESWFIQNIWKNIFHSIDFFKTLQNNNQSTNEVLQFTNINFPTWRLFACSLAVTLKKKLVNNATSRALSGNLRLLLWKYKYTMKENLSKLNKWDLYSTAKYKTSTASWANVNNLTYKINWYLDITQLFQSKPHMIKNFNPILLASQPQFSHDGLFLSDCTDCWPMDQQTCKQI